METPIEAYEFTLQVLEELRKEGIRVETKRSKSSDDAEYVAKKSKDPTTILAKYWTKNSLYFDTPEQQQKIFEATKYLRMAGIGFDIGGCSGQYDWETDWSFRFKKGNDDWEGLEGLEWLYDTLKDMN